MQPKYIGVWIEIDEDGPSYRSSVLFDHEHLSEWIDYHKYDSDSTICEIYEVGKIPDYAKVHIY